jgi:ferredoxin like protein
MSVQSTNERLAANRFVLDEGESHIEINQAVAKATGSAELLIACCPAGVYSWAADGTVAVEYAACLECGSCLIVATPGSLTWRYPRGGFGVQFREG